MNCRGRTLVPDTAQWNVEHKIIRTSKIFVVQLQIKLESHLKKQNIRTSERHSPKPVDLSGRYYVRQRNASPMYHSGCVSALVFGTPLRSHSQ